MGLPHNPDVPVQGDWYLATDSVRGAAHLSSGAPNQDAVAATVAGETIALAVADGHGDHRHFRSARGARFAVAAGCCVGAALGPELAGLGHTQGVVDLALSTLLPRLVATWEGSVAADLAADPLSPQELAQIAEGGDGAVIAYGSTLMLALVSPRWVLLAQIGDGDVVVVGSRGTVQVPVPWDPLLDGHHTTSLCQADAEHSFRIAAIDLAVFGLGALLLATDGYGNAQVDDPWQGPVGVDLAELAAKRGIAWVLSQLPEWAALCASSRGSGDDTTMALLLNARCFPVGAGTARWPPASSDMATVPAKALAILGLGPDRGVEGRRRCEWAP